MFSLFVILPNSSPFTIRDNESWRSQSGDLERLATQAGIDSVSVEELMEEGNTLEAGVVSGVEKAGDSHCEVHAREFPEDVCHKNI